MSLITASNHPPLTAPAETSIREACRQMTDRGVGSVAITAEDGMLVGIFTERDALNRVVVEGLDADNTPIGSVMTSPCKSVQHDRSLTDAVDIMIKEGIRHLAVLDDNHKVIGIVSYRTLMAQLVETLNSEVDGLAAYTGKENEPGG